MFIKTPFRRAFTLVEVLITLTIFAFVAVMAVTLLVNGLRSAKRIQSQVYLYSEAQAVIDKIARDVQGSTVDYEAYYSRNVLGEDGWHTPSYGAYAMSFFDPGSDGYLDGPYSDSGLTGNYGTTCSDGSAYPEDCSSALYDSQDTETNTHPFDGYDLYTTYTDDPTYMNAFCQGSDDHGSSDCAEVAVPVTDELILVNSSGDERILYVLKLIEGSTTEYGLARLVMTGSDSDNDGIEDTWTCAEGYSCTSSTGVDGTPYELDTRDFVSISPLDLSVTTFSILVSPSEDPYRGSGEEDAQLQPQVTLIMELSLSEEYGSTFLGVVPSILIQRTISTGVYSKVLSYE